MKPILSISLSLAAVAVLAGCSKESVDAPQEDAVRTESEADRDAVVATPAAFNAAGAPTVAISVPGMMCEFSCVPTVRKILAEQPGVVDVKVELDTKTATVAVDESTFNADAAIAALVDMQFTEAKLASEADLSDNAGDADL